MIIPERAAVRPRVKRHGGETAFLLEEEIAELAEGHRRGVAVLRGGPGSGKTTALKHLRALLPEKDGIVLVDCDQLSRNETAVVLRGTDSLVVTTLPLGDHYAEWQLEIALWGQDEWIEYLLVRHPSQCKSVMARLLSSEDNCRANYSAEIWRVVLDEMAADETVASPLDAMICRLSRQVSSKQQQALSQLALRAFPLTDDMTPASIAAIIPDADKTTCRLLKQPQVHSWIAAVAAHEHLRSGESGCLTCLSGVGPFRRDFLIYLATQIRNDQLAIANLYRVLYGNDSTCQPAAATILHFAGVLPPPPRWDGPLTGKEFVPRTGPSLSGALLNGAKWQGADLSHLPLANADLTDSDLQQAKLDYANAQKLVLRHANLRGASLEGTTLISACLESANLTCAHASSAFFMSSNCTDARFDEANLSNASLHSTDLTRASFRKARLIGAVLEQATITQADFSLADLSSARLSGLCLHEADFRGAVFRNASLTRCVLDAMALPEAQFEDADLTGSTLTGSSMPGSCFREAKLCNCGLADIEWPGADLFGADLRGAVFSMGGSRSGLVGSPYPGHGTRTGFYTDDFNDLSTHKHPEEIRKANLCGADLRGADIEGVDFYLVDLRGALYDPDQAQQLRRCGAILREPVA